MKLKDGTLAVVLAGRRVDERSVLSEYRPRPAVSAGCRIDGGAVIILLCGP